jgi:hypothetical protein
MFFPSISTSSGLLRTREVILDLLPVYLSGEASPATRALDEEFMKQDAELAQRIRLQWAENFAKIVPSALPPEQGAYQSERGHAAQVPRIANPGATSGCTSHGDP